MNIEKIKVIENLEQLAPFLPAPIYWKDKNSKYLGANQAMIDIYGLKSVDDLIGKNDYELWPELANKSIETDNLVMQSGNTLHSEEMLGLPNGEVKYFTIIKSPLKNAEGHIIGVIGNTIETTHKKRSILKYLDLFASSMPGYIYWKDRNGIYLGMNKGTLEASGLTLFSDFIGKSDYQLWPQNADELFKNDQFVMTTQQTLTKEESVIMPDGTIKYLAATKIPLRDDDGNIIGVIGSSIDITDTKEKERLEIENSKQKFENETQKVILKEHDKFKQIIGQMVHDIQSPLASLQTIVRSANEMPENDRITLRSVAMSIADITNQMLNNYSKKKPVAYKKQRQPILVSAHLLQVLSEKRYEYKKLKIIFDYNFNDNTNFEFIKIEPSSFSRMVSNIINNAVEALQNKDNGKVQLSLSTNKEWVTLIIEDNGCGMPQKLINKIMKNIQVTKGKEHGHGLGLQQVKDTLANNYGNMQIKSVENQGTQVIINFPKIVHPNWVAKEIKIHTDAIIVIVDDDNSTHNGWDNRLAPILKTNRLIKIQHFLCGLEAKSFINNLTLKEKQKVCLLADYELLKQNLNGLEVIKQSSVKNAILVTSHYSNPRVRELAAADNIKILPKSLAFAVPIKFKKKLKANSKKVDMVWVDDARELINDLITRFYSHLKVDVYYNTCDFLDVVEQYPLDTRIILDGFYCDDSGFTIIADGITLAKKLHAAGYNNLYLTSSEDIPEQVLPSYVTFISKHDTENMVILDKLQK